MKLTIGAAMLEAALSSSVAKSTTTHAYGDKALLEASDERLAVVTTDFTQEVTTRTPAGVHEAGTACCDPQRMKAALRGLQGNLSITLEDHHLVMRHPAERPARTFRVPVVQHDAFPRFDVSRNEPLEVDAARLGAAMERVAYAAGKHEPRAYLNGIFMGGSDAIVAATDGHRAAIVAAGDILDFEFPSMIVPTGPAAKLARLMQVDGATVSVIHASGTTPGALRVDTPALSIVARLVDERYPDVARLIPSEDLMTASAVFSCADARAPLERLAGFTGKELKQRGVSVAASGQQMRIELDESAHEELPCMAGNDFDLRICVDYLADVVRLGGDDDITWEHTSQKLAQVFRMASSRAETHIIMPMVR